MFCCTCFLCAFARTESHSDHRPSISMRRWDRARRFPNCTVIYCVMMINVCGSYCSLKYWHETPGKAPFIFVSLFMSHNITAGLEILCRSCYETMRIWAVELFKTFHHILMDIQYSCIWIQVTEPQKFSTDIYLFFVVSASTELLHGLKKTFCSAAMLRCDKLHLKYKYSM